VEVARGVCGQADAGRRAPWLVVRGIAADATREEETPVAHLAALIQSEHDERAERRERRTAIGGAVKERGTK